jgi:4-amino-4-deoxy-L-arabinose transferase-like glycosyltransferase
MVLGKDAMFLPPQCENPPSPPADKDGLASFDWTSTKHCVLLLAWSVFLFFYGTHQGDLYRTEGLRAILGAEMYRSGDWIVPRLYGEPILTKPPFFYWCVALTGEMFGEVSAWSARFPSAVGGCLSVLLIYFIIRRYFGSTWGLVAGLALPCSFLWLDKGSSAEIDTLLVFWVMAAWGCFLRVLESLLPGQVGSAHGSGSLFWWIATLLCVAGGVLTKWTGFLFFYAMALPFLVWRREWRLFFHWKHLLAALLGTALVWSWLGLVIHELGWQQVFSALWQEGAPRVLHDKSPHQQLLLETALHPLKVLALSLPWPVLALLIGWKRLKSRHSFTEKPSSATVQAILQQNVMATLIAWAGMGTLMMTLFPDHNTRQSFSLVPAWTLLGVLSLRWLNSAQMPLPLPGVVSARRMLPSFLLLWALVKIGYVEVLIPARFRARPSLLEQAGILQEAIPASAFLYLKEVKDECLLFTYGRKVQRIGNWKQLPGGPAATPDSAIQQVEHQASSDLLDDAETYCILTENERKTWYPSLVSRIVEERHLLDAQGDRLFVVRLRGLPSP